MTEQREYAGFQAYIDPSAKIGKNVTIGPGTVIGPHVEIGDDNWIGPHVVIQGPCKIGNGNEIFQFASVGEKPQDKKFEGEETWLVIGDNNVIREGCTLHRGTAQDNSITKIGNNNLLMAYVHIAHDCIVGNDNIFANNASLAGHVDIGNYVNVGGFAGIHQFCRIGDHSFLGRFPRIGQDIVPYVLCAGGNVTSVHGLNIEGLKRRGFSRETIMGLKKAYKIIFRQGHAIDKVIPLLEELVPETPEVQLMVDFIKSSERGILR